MRLLRHFGLLVVLAAGSAVLAGPAFGARPAALPSTLGSTHFLVHYQSDLINNPTYAITQTMAGDIAALAERAYSSELADGYPAPVTDGALGGDGRIDIYVQDLSASGALALTVPDNPAGATSSSYIILDGTQAELSLTQHVIAHELFHTIQLSIWQPAQPSDYWLLEGSAEWMGYRADNYNLAFGNGAFFGPPDMSLDCRDPLGTNMCDLADNYANNGYSRWRFFEYLTEKYGASFVQDLFAQGAGGAPSAIAAVSAALAAKGTTLADAYDAWTQADLVGGYSVSALQGIAPTVYGNWQTGTKGGNIGTFLVPVNHLSTRTIEFTRGDGDASHICYSATLSLTVAMPAGTLSKPVFWWNASGYAPVPLTVNGNTATAAIPWDTCTYASTRGYLALPNASTAVDAADFSVKATLAVDPTKQATPVNPPNPVGTATPVIQVGSADVAPTLSLFGPEILKLSSADTVLRLIVESNNQGAVQAKLGSVSLGTLPVRAGNNDLRFKLPAGMLKALRRAASATNVLTLTPTSPNGSTVGQSVTRTVNVLTPKVKQHRK
jgi:hypothetical protein